MIKHIILFILWVVLKLYRYYIKEERPLRLWVPMEADPKARGGLIERLRRLERLSAKGQDRYKPRLSQSNGILAAPDVGDEPIATGEMNGHHSTAIANPPQ